MNTVSTTSSRRYDLDWLRVIMILVVFIFHSGRFFDTMGWHVKNGETYFAVQGWTIFLASWIMPAIFVISGASLFYALGKGSPARFVWDKVLRLAVPLVVGVFTHVALGVYLERVSHSQFAGSFFDFYPQYFVGEYGKGGNFAWMGLHLWYLLVLFVFSLVFLPVFLWLKRGGAGVLRGLTRFLALPGMVYLLAAPIALMSATIDPYAPLGDHNWGGWSLLCYIPLFFYGFIVISSDALQNSIRRLRWLSLGLALANTAGMVFAGIQFGADLYGTDGYTLFNGLFGLNAWLWIMVLLGFGLQRLNVRSRVLDYASEAVLPFYVLHQTVLLVIGYFVTGWEIPDLLKFVLIVVSSFVTIMAIYEFIIRRVNVLRVLFGMKARRAAQPESRSQAVAPAIAK